MTNAEWWHLTEWQIKCHMRNDKRYVTNGRSNMNEKLWMKVDEWKMINEWWWMKDDEWQMMNEKGWMKEDDWKRMYER